MRRSPHPAYDQNTYVGGSGAPNLDMGERGSVTFTAEEAGSFCYVCAYTDHIEHGNMGRFIVEE